MNPNPDKPLTPREELEIRITALLLGELSADDAAAMEAQIAADPDLAKLRKRLERAVELLREASTIAEPAPSTPLHLSPERRERLLAYFKGPIPAPEPAPSPKIVEMRRPKRTWIVPLSLAASITLVVGGAILMFPTIRSAAPKLSSLGEGVKNYNSESFRDGNVEVRNASDFDRGQSKQTEGLSVNRPDEGNVRFAVNDESKQGGAIPYYRGGGGYDDIGKSFAQPAKVPAADEYQRFPAHPATTNLSAAPKNLAAKIELPNLAQNEAAPQRVVAFEQPQISAGFGAGGKGAAFPVTPTTPVTAPATASVADGSRELAANVRQPEGDVKEFRERNEDEATKGAALDFAKSGRFAGAPAQPRGRSKSQVESADDHVDRLADAIAVDRPSNASGVRGGEIRDQIAQGMKSDLHAAEPQANWSDIRQNNLEELDLGWLRGQANVPGNGAAPSRPESKRKAEIAGQFPLAYTPDYDESKAETLNKYREEPKGLLGSGQVVPSTNQPESARFRRESKAEAGAATAEARRGVSTVPRPGRDTATVNVGDGVTLKDGFSVSDLGETRFGFGFGDKTPLGAAPAPAGPGEPATNETTITWASQPGAIRSFSGGKDEKVFKLYNSDQMVLPQVPGALPSSNAETLTAGNTALSGVDSRAWSFSQPRGFVDLNEAVKIRVPGSENEVDLHYPIVDPRAKKDAKRDFGTVANPTEGGKVELNTAAEGTYWDTPSASTREASGSINGSAAITKDTLKLGKQSAPKTPALGNLWGGIAGGAAGGQGTDKFYAVIPPVMDAEAAPVAAPVPLSPPPPTAATGLISAAKPAEPAKRVLIDPQSSELKQDISGLATGGGMGVVGGKGKAPGDVDLDGDGVIDAGDSGIRTAGKLNVAATKVLNAENIQVTGATAGQKPGSSAPVTAEKEGVSETSAEEAAASVQRRREVLARLEKLKADDMVTAIPALESPESVNQYKAAERSLQQLRDSGRGDNDLAVQSATAKLEESRKQLGEQLEQVKRETRAGIEKEEKRLKDLQLGLQKEAKPTQDDAPVAKLTPPTAPIPQPEIPTNANPFSTFSLNVTDVAFKLAAASLESSKMPEAASVRTEEFINAFDYRDPEPAAGVPLAFTSERARYPFAQNRDLLRFSVKTAAAGRQPGRPLNVVLLLDSSGSMERADRVRIVRESLRVLAKQLQPQDKLSVITFSRTPRLWIDGVAGDKAGEATARVSEITPEGGTDLGAALKLGYETALRHYQTGSINRVVLFTDGAANLGDTNPAALKQKVEEHRKQGIALDCFGIGWEGYNDDLLEQLSRNGDGRYGFINTPEAASTEFAPQLAGALRVAASDVKVQVEFNAKRVTAYRQLGYAKHQLKKEQFRDNTVDAAEIGAAESGNALYVVEVNPRGEGDLGVVRVRFRVPGTNDYREHEWRVPFTGNPPALEQASSALRLAGTAAAFAEWLAASPYAGEVTTDRLLTTLAGVPDIYGVDARPKKLEWMIRQAKSISGR